MYNPLSTHIPVVLQSLSHQCGDGLEPNLMVFSKQANGSTLPSSAMSEQSNALVKAVLVVFEEDENKFLEKLASYLCQQNCFKVTTIVDENLVERPSLMSKEAKYTNQPSNFLTPNDAFLVKINSIIEAHLEDVDYRPYMLAKSCFVCEMQLYRELKKLAKLSPANYIRKYRLWRSKFFLSNPVANISDVCCKVGFRSLEYFSRSFKLEFGVCPSAYRSKFL